MSPAASEGMSMSLSATNDTPLLQGSFRLLLLYDVGEEIDLPRLREILGGREHAASPTLPRRTPDYIRFVHAPAVEPCEPLRLKSGETFSCSIKYYSFAVVAVEVEIPFSCGWHSLITQSVRWMDGADVEPAAREIVETHLKGIASAVIKPRKDWLQETYLVINLSQIAAAGAETVTAAQLLSEHGNEIAQLIRGELTPLAPHSIDEALQSSLSYYASDLVVVSASAALVYDRAEDAIAATQVLEFARMQLLEFRYYDNLMSTLLAGIYSTLDRKRNILLSRWTLPRDAQRVNAIRLDVMDLTERVDNAIKFVSDVYYARVYHLCSARIGLEEYRKLVDEKLRTAGELYEFMVGQFNETRSFVLEVAVGILALLDVILLFKH